MTDDEYPDAVLDQLDRAQLVAWARGRIATETGARLAQCAASDELLNVVDAEAHAIETIAAAGAAWSDELEELTADYGATIVRRLAAGELELEDVLELLGRLVGTGLRLGAIAGLDVTRSRYKATHREALSLELAVRGPSALDR